MGQSGQSGQSGDGGVGPAVPGRSCGLLPRTPPRPATHATPPDTIANGTPTDPPTTSPPCRRRRARRRRPRSSTPAHLAAGRSSGADAGGDADRNTPEIMLAPPVAANMTRTGRGRCTSPATAIAAPHTATQHSPPGPTLDAPLDPLSSDVNAMRTRDRREQQADSSGPPPSRCASAGAAPGAGRRPSPGRSMPNTLIYHGVPAEKSQALEDRSGRGRPRRGPTVGGRASLCTRSTRTGSSADIDAVGAREPEETDEQRRRPRARSSFRSAVGRLQAKAAGRNSSETRSGSSERIEVESTPNIPLDAGLAEHEEDPQLRVVAPSGSARARSSSSRARSAETVSSSRRLSWRSANGPENREEQQGPELHRPEQADVERRAGLMEHLVGSAAIVIMLPKRRHGLADPQSPEFAAIRAAAWCRRAGA